MSELQTRTLTILLLIQVIESVMIFNIFDLSFYAGNQGPHVFTSRNIT